MISEEINLIRNYLAIVLDMDEKKALEHASRIWDTLQILKDEPTN